SAFEERSNPRLRKWSETVCCEIVRIQRNQPAESTRVQWGQFSAQTDGRSSSGSRFGYWSEKGVHRYHLQDSCLPRPGGHELVQQIDRNAPAQTPHFFQRQRMISPTFAEPSMLSPDDSWSRALGIGPTTRVYSLDRCSEPSSTRSPLAGEIAALCQPAS